MTPYNYARLFAHPHAESLLYWLDELVCNDQAWAFESDPGHLIHAQIVVNGPDSRALTTDHWSIPFALDRRDRVTLIPRFQSDTDPWSEPVRSVLRCLGMPPARDMEQVATGLNILSASLRLRNSFVRDAAERGLQLKDPDIAEFLIGLERHVIEHTKECVRMCNTGDEARESIEQIEAKMHDYVKAGSLALGISPVVLDFNRDPRGATVLINHEKKERDQDATVSVRHRHTTLRLNRNILREAIEPQLVERNLKVWDAETNQMQSQSEHQAAMSPKKTPSRAAAAKAGAPATTVVASDIAPDLLVILRDGQWSRGNVFKIPEGQLERKLYERVAESIKLAGGKWSTTKQGFVFKDGPEKFTALLATGQAIDRKQYDFFWTPVALAQKVVEESNLQPGMLVLEPSAGDGRIADAAAAVVGVSNVMCYELLPENVAKLRAKGYTVIEGDFLCVEPDTVFDRVLMNPPFGNQADMRHVEHAAKFLKPDGQLVSIMGTAYQSRDTAVADSFRNLLETAGDFIQDIEPGAFKESGTNVATVMISLDADRLPWNQTETAPEPVRELMRG